MVTLAGVLAAESQRPGRKRRHEAEEHVVQDRNTLLKLIKRSCPIMVADGVRGIRCSLILQLFGVACDNVRRNVLAAMAADPHFSEHTALGRGSIGRLVTDVGGVARLCFVGGDTPALNKVKAFCADVVAKLAKPGFVRRGSEGIAAWIADRVRQQDVRLVFPASEVENADGQ